MKRMMAAAVALAFIVGAPALAQQGGPSPRVIAVAGPARILQASDKAFAVDAAKGGMAEVELSKLAEQRSANAEVKRFAQMMIDEHDAANQQLTTLAEQKKIVLPKELDAGQRKIRDEMAKLSKAAFDRRFMAIQSQEHEKAVALFRKAVESGQDPDLTKFAADTLPKLEMHQKMARELSQKISGSNRPS